MPTRRFTLIALLSFHGVAALASAAPVAPSNCVAAGLGTSAGTKIGISWRDNSADEAIWRIEYSTNNWATYSFVNVATSNKAGTGNTETVVLNATPNLPYVIRVLAYNGSQLSTASNVASVTAKTFTVTPVLVPNQVAINLSWPDVAGASGYDVYRIFSGGSYSHVGTAPGGATGFQVASPAVSAAQTCYFQVVPYLANTPIISSDLVNIDLNVITSRTGISGVAGAALSHTFTQSAVAGVSSRSLKWNGQSALPAGLAFNAGTGVLSGAFPAVGNYVLKYSVNLADGAVLTQDFAVRVRSAAGAPLIGSVIPAWNGAAGSTRETDLAGAFIDPEAESAVRVATSLGDMDFILFDAATPATVANFKNYMNSGRFTGVSFHRSISGFMIQSGGFRGSGSGSAFSSVSTYAPVVNEPGISNLRGTLSMAKIAGDPNSATSQFFINLANNSANLDYQNAGFTVFGRVAGDGMAVADAIAALPTATYDLLLDGGPAATRFADFPMNASSAPPTMDQTKLVRIESVATIPTIAYSVTGNTDPSVATADIVAGKLHLVGLAGGHTTITITGTDLDHLTNTQTVEVNLADTYAGWTARNTFPGAQDAPDQNPDGDLLNNLEEYAFLGNPALPDSAGLPAPGISGVSPAPRFLTLTFPVRKLTSGLNYVVEGADSIDGSWVSLWQSADGFSGPLVVASADQADRTVVTIRDNVAIGISPRRFLRVRIGLE